MMRNDICRTYIQHKSSEGDAQAAIILMHLMENEEAQVTDKITAEELKTGIAKAIKDLRGALVNNEYNRDEGNYSDETQTNIVAAIDRLLDILAGI